MFRTLIALLGLAVIGAVFAGVYYAPQNLAAKEGGTPAFNPGHGEARTFAIQPSLEGSPILVEVEVLEGEVDVYLMDKEWASTLVAQRDGTVSLQRPFSFHAEHSAIGVEGRHNTTVVSDGETWLLLVIDNSDNYYADDTVPDENSTAKVRITTRYVAEEQRSLVLGYLAAAPSVLLVVVTLGRQAQRWRKARREERATLDEARP